MTHSHDTTGALDYLVKIRTLQTCILGSTVTLLFVMGFIATNLIEISQTEAVTADNDFRIFWATAKVALEQSAYNVFDQEKLAAIHQISKDSWMPWLYPPGYLALITPFGMMSFGVAWIVFVLISVIATAIAFRPIASPTIPVLLGCVLAPAYIPALIMGQNSLIWMAVLLFALNALRNGRMVLAGALIGCLTLKPQLGILIPFALLAISAWSTIATATIATVLIAAIPTAFYGLDYWVHLSEILSQHSARVQATIPELGAMVSLFSMLTELGVATGVALKLQWALTALSAAIVFAIWRRDDTGWDLKFAVLLICTSLAVPYYWYYETVLFVPIALFMLRAGTLRARWPDHALLLVLWLGLSPIIGAGMYGFEQLPETRMLTPPILIICLILCLRQVWRDRHATVYRT